MTPLEAAVRQYCESRHHRITVVDGFNPDPLLPDLGHWTRELSAETGPLLLYLREAFILNGTPEQREQYAAARAEQGKHIECAQISDGHGTITIDYHPDGRGYLGLTPSGEIWHVEPNELLGWLEQQLAGQRAA